MCSEQGTARHPSPGARHSSALLLPVPCPPRAPPPSGHHQGSACCVARVSWFLVLFIIYPGALSSDWVLCGHPDPEQTEDERVFLGGGPGGALPCRWLLTFLPWVPTRPCGSPGQPPAFSPEARSRVLACCHPRFPWADRKPLRGRRCWDAAEGGRGPDLQELVRGWSGGRRTRAAETL